MIEPFLPSLTKSANNLTVISRPPTDASDRACRRAKDIETPKKMLQNHGGDNRHRIGCKQDRLAMREKRQRLQQQHCPANCAGLDFPRSQSDRSPNITPL